MIKYLGIFISILLFPLVGKSDHYAGASISWVCAGPNTYTITLEIYRDCAPPSASWVENWIYALNLCTNFTTQLTMGIPTVTEISQVCTQTITNCDGGSVRGYQRYRYIATHTITGCGEFDLYWGGWARNEGVSNLQNSDTQSLAVRAYTTNPCTPSAQWISDPMPYACRQTPSSYAWTCFAPQGTATYATQVCLQAYPNLSSNYSGGNNGITPLGGWNLNSTTGIATFNNNQAGIYAIAARCSISVDGVLRNWVMRDQMFTVIACNNSSPTIIAPELIVVCPNQTISLQGPIYSVVVSDLDGDLVMWGPQTYTAPPTPGLYPLVVGASDDFCPIQGESFALINVLVWCPPLDLVPYLQQPTVVLHSDGADQRFNFWDVYNLLGQRIMRPF